MESLPKFMRNTVACLLVSGALAVLPAGGQAQVGLPDGTPAESGPAAEDQSPANQRYGLVEANGDILRIDREAGSVSFCRKINGSWRCRPAPLAEQAYQEEIADLSREVDRLKTRIRELEAEARPDSAAPQPEADKSEPPQLSEDGTPPVDKEKASPSLSDEDEQQLERMMQFSEKAMRRFFGLMKDLQTEFGGN